MRRIVIISAVALALGAGALTNSILESTGNTSSMALSTASPTIGIATLEETVDEVDGDAIAWAQDRYREAGLSLPDMRVSFHRDNEFCEGAHGGHLIEDGVSRIFICIPEQGRSRESQIKRVLLHEFAHAWDHFALTDEIRSEFMSFKGLPGWSFEVAYDERASEAAAEIITWGLMDRPIRINSLHDTWTWEERREGYGILAGSEPPHGYVWSFFAAAHDVYAHTTAQVELVKEAWELSDGKGRVAESIEVRFHEDNGSCADAATSSELIGDRLHIQACPVSESELSAALLATLTGG